MVKTQGEIEKARMGEDDTCADESCRVERAANTAMIEGAQAVKEEQERKEQEPGYREESAAYALMKEGAMKAQEPKERVKASVKQVKENIKTGFKLIGDDIRAGAKEKAAELSEEYIGYSPRKAWGMPEKKAEPAGKKKYDRSSYLPATRGGFNFPQMGQPVSFSQKPQSRKEKKSQRVHARVVTGKMRPFSSGVGMHVGGPIGTGMSFVPPAVPRFGSPATPKSTFSMPFPRADIKSPRFGESHFGKSVPKREFTRGMSLDIDFSSSPFGKKKTNPLKGKKGGLW